MNVVRFGRGELFVDGRRVAILEEVTYVSNKIWKEGRCGRCGKRPEDDVHQTEKSPGLLHRLLHLAWPRWTWAAGGRHEFVDRDRAVHARDGMAELKRFLKRGRR